MAPGALVSLESRRRRTEDTCRPGSTTRVGQGRKSTTGVAVRSQGGTTEGAVGRGKDRVEKADSWVPA